VLSADTATLPVPTAGSRESSRPVALSPRRERALVRSAQRGDRDAVEQLFRAHWRACHRTATLVTGDAAAAEDIAQEAFLAAIGALHRFDHRRPLGPWLRTIVARRAIDFTRLRAGRREVDGAPLEEIPGPEAAAAGLSDDLIAAIAALSPERREVVVLRHLLELTPREIGALLGLPVGTVNSRLRRALDQLRANREAARVVGVLLALAIAAAAVAVPGPDAVARWVASTARALVGVPAHRPNAALSRLPGGGRVLVQNGRGAWIAGQGSGPRAIPGSSGQTSWSAFGNYVVQARGDVLQALAVDGRVAWSRRFPAPVTFPRWSPDGNRIAFRMGTEAWVVAGDGTGAHSIGTPLTGAAALAAAWRPGPGHVVAIATGPHAVSVIDADSGGVLRRLATRGPRVALLWASGPRLLVVKRRSVLLWGSHGPPAQDALPPGARYLAAAVSPSGRQVALLRDVHGVQEVRLASAAHPGGGRLVARGLALGDLAYSPDGRWLLVGWHAQDSWLFVATGPGDRRVLQVRHVSRRFGGGEPLVSGWCCHA
jgi:RNA polymerase sigma-70 factor (ECF subfamily)